MQRPERHSSGPRLNSHLDPQLLRRARARRQLAEGAVAQDFLQYSLADYDRRRGRGAATWRDLYPAYAFALRSHSAGWPRGSTDVDDELAAYWEMVRGESRLEWWQARGVVEDAWQALDHMPVSARIGLQ